MQEQFIHDLGRDAWLRKTEPGIYIEHTIVECNANGSMFYGPYPDQQRASDALVALTKGKEMLFAEMPHLVEIGSSRDGDE